MIKNCMKKIKKNSAMVGVELMTLKVCIIYPSALPTELLRHDEDRTSYFVIQNFFTSPGNQTVRLSGETDARYRPRS